MAQSCLNNLKLDVTKVEKDSKNNQKCKSEKRKSFLGGSSLNPSNCVETIYSLEPVHMSFLSPFFLQKSKTSQIFYYDLNLVNLELNLLSVHGVEAEDTQKFQNNNLIINENWPSLMCFKWILRTLWMVKYKIQHAQCISEWIERSFLLKKINV